MSRIRFDRASPAIQLRLDELSLHDDPAVVSEAEAALGQVERLAAELDELVAASRDEPVQPHSIDVSSLIMTLVGDFDQAFTAEERTLAASFSGDAIARSAGPGRLREASSVLVDNALQHGSGECRISVSDLKGDMLRITVSDEGPGVADDVATDIFRRGFSGGASRLVSDSPRPSTRRGRRRTTRTHVATAAGVRDRGARGRPRERPTPGRRCIVDVARCRRTGGAAARPGTSSVTWVDAHCMVGEAAVTPAMPRCIA